MQVIKIVFTLIKQENRCNNIFEFPSFVRMKSEITAYWVCLIEETSFVLESNIVDGNLTRNLLKHSSKAMKIHKAQKWCDEPLFSVLRGFASSSSKYNPPIRRIVINGAAKSWKGITAPGTTVWWAGLAPLALLGLLWQLGISGQLWWLRGEKSRGACESISSERVEAARSELRLERSNISMAVGAMASDCRIHTSPTGTAVDLAGPETFRRFDIRQLAAVTRAAAFVLFYVARMGLIVWQWLEN